MTIATTHSRMDYTGTGATDNYSYTFKIFSASDLLVTQQDDAGVETTLTLNTDYTVSGVGDTSGGSITLLAGNLPASYLLTIRRVRELKQETDLRTQGDFYPEIHEDEFDKQMMVDQQQQVEIDRSMKLPETVSGISVELPVPVALKLYRVNAAATALEHVSIADISSIVSTVGDDLQLVGSDLSLTNPVRFGAAGGTVDAITTTTSPAPAALDDNLKIILAAAGANATTTPTFAPDGLAAKTIVKGSDEALVAGDIPGANFRAELVFDDSLDKWVLLNPKFSAIVERQAEIQAGSLVYVDESGAADVYVLTLVPAVTAYTKGMVVSGQISAANLTTTPTLNVNALGAKTIKREGGAALLVGDLPLNYMAVFQYDGTDMILLNPALVKNHTHASVAEGGTLTPLGAWDATKVYNTTYSAATDGFVTTYITGCTAGTQDVLGKTDGSTPPTTVVAYQRSATAGDRACITFPVRAGDNWRVDTNCTASHTIVIYWIPLG